MPQYSEIHLACICGHTGTVDKKENDSPHSAEHSEYSPNGFKGNSYDVVREFKSTADVLKAMKLSCPKCKAKITAANVVK